MVRTLITGMSAVGKSSVISELIKLGHRAIDLDTDEWSMLVPDDSSYADLTTDLLTIPVTVAIDRLANRTTNMYGKDPAELERQLELRTSIEPLPRRSACLEINTATHPIPDVATMIMNHLEQGHNAPHGD